MRAFWGALATMIIFRFLALVLIVAALMVLGHDAIASLQGSDASGEMGVQMLSLTGLWDLLDAGSRQSFLDWANATNPTLGSVSATVLTWPAFAVLGVIGVVLAFVFRARED